MTGRGRPRSCRARGRSVRAPQPPASSSVVTSRSVAPSASASAALSGVRLSTVTSAPSATAILTARCPSPPRPATAIAAPPADSGRPHRLPDADPGAEQRRGGGRVEPVRQVESELLAEHVLAAVRALRRACRRCGRRRRRWWSVAPSSSSPGRPGTSAHSPQESTIVPIATASPTANPVTSEPISSTLPVASWPGTSSCSPSIPWIRWRSLWQTPQKSMRTARSSSPEVASLDGDELQ